MVFIKRRGYRRVVPSPKPIRILEDKLIKKLFQGGDFIIACGGGGIPVIQHKGRFKGVEAVIDKDLCAVELAKLIRADWLLILTDVEGVYIDYEKRSQRLLRKLTLKEAKRYLTAGQFGEGSMKPKIEACIEFLKNGGKKCFIGSSKKALEIVRGKAGTVLLR